MASGQQAIEYQLQRFPVLEGLTVGQHHRRDTETFQSLLQGLQIKRGDGFIGHYRDLPTRYVPSQQLGAREQPTTDIDGITALAEFNVKSLHEAPRIKRALG